MHLEQNCCLDPWRMASPETLTPVTHTRRGILAEEEAQLYKLRQEKEGEARRALLQEKEKYEAESKQQVQVGVAARPLRATGPVLSCALHQRAAMASASPRR